MFLSVFAVGSLLLAFICIFFAFRLLSNIRWLIPWFKISSGLAVFFMAVFLCFVNVDLLRYTSFKDQEELYEVRIQKIAEQKFAVSLIPIQKGLPFESEIILSSDQWSMSYQAIVWGDGIAKVGSSGGYLVTGFHGRFYSLTQAREEGEAHIAPFLEAHKDARVGNIANPDIFPEVALHDDGYLRTHPAMRMEDGGMEGFFAVIFEKMA